jgi:hypothetical protein
MESILLEGFPGKLAVEAIPDLDDSRIVLGSP